MCWYAGHLHNMYSMCTLATVYVHEKMVVVSKRKRKRHVGIKVDDEDAPTQHMSTPISCRPLKILPSQTESPAFRNSVLVGRLVAPTLTKSFAKKTGPSNTALTIQLTSGWILVFIFQRGYIYLDLHFHVSRYAVSFIYRKAYHFRLPTSPVGRPIQYSVQCAFSAYFSYLFPFRLVSICMCVVQRPFILFKYSPDSTFKVFIPFK